MKLGVTGSAKVGPRKVKLVEKARDIKPGERVYHPDENLGVGEELARKYAATYDWHTPQPSEMIH